MGLLNHIQAAMTEGKRLLSILIDPEKFVCEDAFAKAYLKKIPLETTHFLVGGSTDPDQKLGTVIQLLKQHTTLPILIFPGSHYQISNRADGLLFLSLVSGDNAQFLIGEQRSAAFAVYQSTLEVIATGYMLLDGGTATAVQRVSGTQPISQKDEHMILATALASQYLGHKLLYLEAGSGASYPVAPEVIKKVRSMIDVPVIVGGGIRSRKQLESAYLAGATMVVIGTAFENDSWQQ